MKCGSCRIGNAASYTKILEGHPLFETLKKLNPGRTYNEKYSYFCGLCLATAAKKLDNSSLLVRDQNANSLSVRNASFTDKTIEVSMDEYDLLVAPKIVFSNITSQSIQPTRNNRIGTEIKRKTTSDSTKIQDRPCPKRFKKQFKGNKTSSIRENDNAGSVGEGTSSHKNDNAELVGQGTSSRENDNAGSVGEGTSSRENDNVELAGQGTSSRENDNAESVGQGTSSQNSEEVSEADILLNIQRDNAASVSSGEKGTSRASVESSQTVAIVGQVQSSDIIEAVSEDVVFHNADSVSNGELANSRASLESSRIVGTVIQRTSSPSAVVSSRQVLTVTRSSIVSSLSTVLSSRHGATVTHPTNQLSNSVTWSPSPSNKTANVINDGEQDVDEQMNSSQNSSIVPLSTLQQKLSIAGPSAPAVKNPRTRQENDQLLRDSIRSYFNENSREIDVNNYSRLTAG